jgi:hypothetical protein
VVLSVIYQLHADPGFERLTTDPTWISSTAAQELRFGLPVATEEWEPLHVRTELTLAGAPIPPRGDFLGFLVGTLIMTERAHSMMADDWLSSGQLLPAVSEDDQAYSLLNVTKRVACLDLDRSDVSWHRPGTARHIRRWVFIDELLPGDGLFKLDVHASYILATEEFAVRLRSSGLTGYELKKLWSNTGGA